jgi:hypothetical protein
MADFPLPGFPNYPRATVTSYPEQRCVVFSVLCLPTDIRHNMIMEIVELRKEAEERGRLERKVN